MDYKGGVVILSFLYITNNLSIKSVKMLLFNTFNTIFVNFKYLFYFFKHNNSMDLTPIKVHKSNNKELI